MTPHEQAREAIISLQNALITQNPLMPTILRKIHTQLKNDPEIVTLLNPEEIGIVVQACAKQTNTEIAAVMQKAKTKSLKSMSADDI